jgi:hypothetical protein
VRQSLDYPVSRAILTSYHEIESLTNTNNAQPLVHQDSAVGSVISAPVRSTVLDLLAHANGRRPELLHIGVTAISSQRIAHPMVSCLALKRTGDSRRFHTSLRLIFSIDLLDCVVGRRRV